MNLIETAESDLNFTLEDVETGFGVSLTFFTSVGLPKVIPCQTTDISYFMDPETGQGISSRTVEITGRITTFENNEITPSVGDIVKYYDTNNVEYKSSIRQTIPDRKIGVYKIILEARKDEC